MAPTQPPLYQTASGCARCARTPNSCRLHDSTGMQLQVLACGTQPRGNLCTWPCTPTTCSMWLASHREHAHPPRTPCGWPLIESTRTHHVLHVVGHAQRAQAPQGQAAHHRVLVHTVFVQLVDGHERLRCACVHVCLGVYACVCVHMCVHARMCMHVCMCACVHS